MWNLFGIKSMDKIKISQTVTSARTALALFFSLVALASNAAELSVPGDYATIQGAISAAQSGDQIIVGEGIYEENVIIDKPLLLLSDRARIDVFNEYAAITIASDDVQVSGFDIRTTGASAIEAGGYGGVMIDSCQFYGGNILLDFSKGTTISNCFSGGATFAIRSMGNGFYGGVSDVITQCDIWAAFVGIDVTFASVPVIISSNAVHNCSIGIDVGESSGVSLVGNYVSNPESGNAPLRFYSEFIECNVDLTGNNVFAVGYPSTDVTALTLLNEGFETLTVTGHFNRFGASNAVSVSGGGTVVTDLTNNWWGKNSAPISDVSVSPWLTMSVSPQSAMATNGSIEILCNWFTNSAAQDVSALGLLPDSRDGIYTCNGGGCLVDPVLDNRIPLQITAGASSVLYYPTTNSDIVTATLDYQTIPVLINP
jgi:parallel beta-helix repeat protein